MDDGAPEVDTGRSRFTLAPVEGLRVEVLPTGGPPSSGESWYVELIGERGLLPEAVLRSFPAGSPRPAALTLDHPVESSCVWWTRGPGPSERRVAVLTIPERAGMGLSRGPLRLQVLAGDAGSVLWSRDLHGAEARIGGSHLACGDGHLFVLDYVDGRTDFHVLSVAGEVRTTFSPLPGTMPYVMFASSPAPRREDAVLLAHELDGRLGRNSDVLLEKRTGGGTDAAWTRVFPAFGVPSAAVSVQDGNEDGVPEWMVGWGGAGDADSYVGRVERLDGATGKTVWVMDGTVPKSLFGIDLAVPGDVDGDGSPDVAALELGGADGVEEGALTLLSGRDGTVLRRFPVPLGDHPMGVATLAVGDRDGDGIGDIGIVGCWSPSVEDGAVELRVLSSMTGKLLP